MLRCLLRVISDNADIDGNGTLEGDELLEMSKWLIKLESTSTEYEPPRSEVIETRDKILNRFDKTATDSVSMRELAIVHEEILVIISNVLNYPY